MKLLEELLRHCKREMEEGRYIRGIEVGGGKRGRRTGDGGL